jgi:exosortase A
MSADLAPAVALDPVAPAPAAARPGHTLLAIGASAAMIALLYHQTFWSMMLIWWRSQTFAHGFAIVPISAWLIWRQREQLASLPLRPCGVAFLPLAALGAAWLLADAANVQVVMQYAAMAMIPIAVLAMLGRQVAQAIAFPLAYLLLAVPFGEVFLAPLMDFTASFTVAALQLSGIPVFRENNLFSIPSGNWSVVEACSGLRYVIALVALGTLYAYLNYRSLRRRLIFIAAALILPIFANGVRAYSIVLIGHWSDMRLAVGVDHLIYGWAFFGLVSLLLFWAGSFWREAPLPLPVIGAEPPGLILPATTLPIKIGAAAGIAISACWPLMAALLLGQAGDESAAASMTAPRADLRIAAPQLPWTATGSVPGQWRAGHAGNPLTLEQGYRNRDQVLALQLAWYGRQEKGAELLTPVDPLDSPPYRELENRLRSIELAGTPLSVRQSVLQSGAKRVLVWRWYRQGGVDTSNPFLVKFLLAKSKLLHARQDGAEIIVSTPFDDKPAQARAEALLQQFLDYMLPAIDQGLHHVAAH